jgi:hypothetical protein
LFIDHCVIDQHHCAKSAFAYALHIAIAAFNEIAGAQQRQVDVALTGLFERARSIACGGAGVVLRGWCLGRAQPDIAGSVELGLLGDTGCGATRGGSMTRNSPTPDFDSMSPDMAADSRRVISAS